MAAGTVSEKQAEAIWSKYNKDGDDKLTVEEVTDAIKDICEEEGDVQSEVKARYMYFGQDEPKSLSKWEFIQGIMRTKKCQQLRKAFQEMDTNGNGKLCESELKEGLKSQGFDDEVAAILVDEVSFDEDEEYDFEEFLEAVAFSETFAKSYSC